MEYFVFILVLITFVSVSCSFRIVYRIKKQLLNMAEALEDIKNGNGNRRTLAETHEIAAPLAYAINDIIQSYESRLAAFHLTEETNKQLMTNLSHDVRTPLTTLIGYLDACYKGFVTGKKRDEYLETARRKAYDLKDYIDVLFDWFKLNSNELLIETETIEIAEFTRNILIEWIPIFENNCMNYLINISEQPFYVQLDLDGYVRVLNNLIQNVIAHSHADKIEITLSKQNTDVKILLSDNGIGIEKEDLNYIFERLYKCDKGRSKKGSGLGLSIVHQLVERNGGKISVESKPANGSIFTILFPLVN